MKKDNFKTYNELFSYICTLKNNNFLNYLKDTNYTSISIKNFHDKVINLSIKLKEYGIKKEDKVAIYIDSSAFWLIFDFAIHQLGAISVPIFSNISKHNLNFQLEDSKAKFIIIDNEQSLKDIKNKSLIFITHKFKIIKENHFNVDNILFNNKQVKNKDEFLPVNQNEDDIFSIIYTSGNTGTPKGVVLSNKNIITQIKDINELLQLDIKKDKILSVLPLAHIFERTVMSYYISKGVSIYFIDDIKNIAPLLKIVNPTLMTAVPRLLEKIYYKISFNISQKTIISKFIAKSAFKYANKTNLNKNALLYKIYDNIVYSKLREVFGLNLKKLISGGASLNKDICQFFTNIGIDIYQGYGLSEFSPVVCSNYPQNNKIGSCGKALAGVEVKLSKDSELLVRGDSLMQGYLNQEELTNETIIDGWLHTGDLAEIDEDNYIYIKSRLKEIYKTSTGEYIFAVGIEQLLAQNEYIEFSVVIAENRQFVTALLFVDQERFNILNYNNLNIDEYFNQIYVKKSINKHIESINKKLNKYEQIKKYRFITQSISIEGGELTPSMKVCRKKIEEKYINIIDEMYKD